MNIVKGPGFSFRHSSRGKLVPGDGERLVQDAREDVP